MQKMNAFVILWSILSKIVTIDAFFVVWKDTIINRNRNRLYRRRLQVSKAIASNNNDTPVSLGAKQHIYAASESSFLEYVDQLLVDAQTRHKYDDEVMTKISPLAILEIAQKHHLADYEAAKSSSLVMEEQIDDSERHHHLVPYEWIQSSSSNNNPIAIQSLEPVLNETEIRIIRSAAEQLWNKDTNDSPTVSRFTYQYKHNSEAHVSDLEDENAINVVNQLLSQRLYPLIQKVFMSDNDDNDLIANQLFVYDAIIIRYNATASNTNLAGQPLHCDLGFVSVNIMLNNDFNGGGTYFDNQYSIDNHTMNISDKANTIEPIKPSGGPGHCLIHFSNERHAGAGTKQGVRDIFVAFISLQQPTSHLLNTYVKQTRDGLCQELMEHDEVLGILCRIQHQRLAIVQDPADGEAYLYLGTALMDYAKLMQSGKYNNCIKALEHAIKSFQYAVKLNPNDARNYNNWGIAMSRLEDQLKLQQVNTTQSLNMVELISKIYQKGLNLLMRASNAGCDVVQDMDSLCLNYGLYLAKQDLFMDASDVLKHPAFRKIVAEEEEQSPSSNKTRQDALRLWKFCKDQTSLNKQGSTSVSEYTGPNGNPADA